MAVEVPNDPSYLVSYAVGGCWNEKRSPGGLYTEVTGIPRRSTVRISMLLTSVSDVALTMVPDVTNMALPYCDGYVHFHYVGPDVVWPTVGLLHADDCTLVLAAEVSDKLLLRWQEALDIEGHVSESRS